MVVGVAFVLEAPKSPIQRLLVRLKSRVRSLRFALRRNRPKWVLRRWKATKAMQESAALWSHLCLSDHVFDPNRTEKNYGIEAARYQMECAAECYAQANLAISWSERTFEKATKPFDEMVQDLKEADRMVAKLAKVRA